MAGSGFTPPARMAQSNEAFQPPSKPRQKLDASTAANTSRHSARGLRWSAALARFFRSGGICSTRGKGGEVISFHALASSPRSAAADEGAGPPAPPDSDSDSDSDSD